MFEADLQTGELRKDGLRIKLQEQTFRVLTLLLERAGEVVTREELRQRLWSTDTFVDFEHSLNTSIKKLRQTLGDSANNPRFVETLARRGYRFIAPVNQPRQALEDKIPQPAISKDADNSSPAVAKEAGSRVRRLVFASVVLAMIIALFGSYWLAHREKEGVTTISSLATSLSSMPVAIPTSNMSRMASRRASSIVFRVYGNCVWSPAPRFSATNARRQMFGT